MKNAFNDKHLEWIPWRRFALLLGVDEKKRIFVGRFPFRKVARREADRLSMLKGYEAEVFDTKAQSGI